MIPLYDLHVNLNIINELIITQRGASKNLILSFFVTLLLILKILILIVLSKISAIWI
jgi:hypothetical protein